MQIIKGDYVQVTKGMVVAAGYVVGLFVADRQFD